MNALNDGQLLLAFEDMTAVQPVTDNGLLHRYEEFKRKRPDALALIRCNGVYVALNDDADAVDRILLYGVVQYDDRREAVFGIDDLDHLLPKLIRQGYRVGIID
jgi:DNA mismatch repair ATPase MutS